LEEHSERWQNRKDNEAIIIILHSCQVAEAPENLPLLSFAEQVSRNLKGITIIASDTPVVSSASGEKGAYKTKNGKTSNEPGYWKIFEDGKQKGAYRGDWKPKEKPTWWEQIMYPNINTTFPEQ
jgi:hypothetical protein